MAQTTSVRSATIAASVTASPRIRHCKRDSDGRHRHHDSRQDRNQDRNQDRHQDSRHERHHERHQDCCLTAPMTRATPAEMRWLGGVTVARAGFAPTGSAGEPAGRVGMRSARLLPASNSSAKTAVARRRRGSVVRAASAAAWAIAARVHRTGGIASAATRACLYRRAALAKPSGNAGNEACGSSRWPAAGLPFRHHRR